MYIKWYKEFYYQITSNPIMTIHCDIYQTIAYTSNQSNIQEVSYMILPHSSTKVNPIPWEQQCEGYTFTLKCLLIIFPPFFFPSASIWLLEKWSIFLQGAVHFGQISACNSHWLPGTQRWRERLPSSNSSSNSKIWNQVTKGSKHQITCAKKVYFISIYFHLQKLPLKQSILVKQYFKSRS